MLLLQPSCDSHLTQSHKDLTAAVSPAFLPLLCVLFPPSSLQPGPRAFAPAVLVPGKLFSQISAWLAPSGLCSPHLPREAVADHLHLPPLSILLILSSSSPKHHRQERQAGGFSWCVHWETLSSEVELDAEQALPGICGTNTFFKGPSLLDHETDLGRQLRGAGACHLGSGEHPRQTRLSSWFGVVFCV